MGSGQQRSGFFSVGILELTHAVVFDTPMPDEPYQVFVQPLSSVGASYWPSDVTGNGFTLNLSAGVNAKFSYLAIATL